MKLLALVIINFLILQNLFCQTADIDKLRQRLPYIKDSAEYIDVLNKLSTLSNLRSLDSCYYYAILAKGAADRNNYSYGKAMALKNMGLSFLGRNDYLSVAYSNESLNLFTELNDTVGICQLLNNIGVANNESATAISYYNRAYQLGKKLQKDSILSIIIVNLLNKDTALTPARKEALFLEGYAIAKKYHNLRIILYFEKMEGIKLYRQGKKEDGMNMLKQAADEAGRLGIESVKLDIYIYIGELLIDDQLPEGLSYWQQGLAIAQTGKYLINTKYLADKLYRYYLEHGDSARATVYSSLLLNEFYKSDSAFTESGFTNYVLKEKALEDAKIRSKAERKIIITLACLVVLIIALVLFVFRSYSAKAKLSEALKKLKDTAEEKNAVLEANNVFNNKLLTIIAHDLRQPFSSVIMTAGLMETDEKMTIEEVKHILHLIRDESEKSIRFMDGLIRWVKLQMQGFVYHPSELNIDSLMEEAINFNKLPIDEKKLEIVKRYSSEQTIKGDREMLLFINRNLLSNAVKFSHSKGMVTINVAVHQQEIIVFFTDRGKGMTKEQFRQLFAYKDGGELPERNIKSAGIALIICRDMIHKMNGRIWAESEEGNGATFYYALPF